MRKLLLIFAITSLLKGILLFLLISLGIILTVFSPPLQFLIFFLTISLIDWRVFNIISPSIEKWKWVKLLGFAYGSFILVLWITGPLFRLKNLIYNIQPKEASKMTIEALITFLVIGFIFSSMTSMIWTKKMKDKQNLRQ